MQSDDSLSSSMDDFADSVQDADIPEELPMMAVRDVVVFNYMILPLFVGRPNSVSAVNEAMSGSKMLMLVTQKEVSSDKPEPEDLYELGMVVQIMRSLKLPDMFKSEAVELLPDNEARDIHMFKGRLFEPPHLPGKAGK